MQPDEVRLPRLGPLHLELLPFPLTFEVLILHKGQRVQEVDMDCIEDLSLPLDAEQFGVGLYNSLRPVEELLAFK